jgi:hypothetical protein
VAARSSKCPGSSARLGTGGSPLVLTQSGRQTNASRIRELNATIQYTMWSVFRLADRLGPGPRAGVTHEVERLLDELAANGVAVRGTYDVSGLRADADVMVWWHAPSADALQQAYGMFRRTALGRHLAPVWYSNIRPHSATQVQLTFTDALIVEGRMDRVPACQDGLVDPTVDDPARPILLAVSDNRPQTTSGSTREFMAMCAIAQHFGRPGPPTDRAWIVSLHVKANGCIVGHP